MSIFGFRKQPTSFLRKEEEEYVVQCIQEAERNTSGEIRVFIESKCPYYDALDRAKEVFFELEMDTTQFKNGVLIYLAFENKKIAIYGDQGIYEQTNDTSFWESILSVLQTNFQNDNFGEGIGNAILDIGKALSKYFPYDQKGDTNELPDDIVYGK